MMRYYRVREGRPDVNGFVIRVNPKAPLEKKVSDFIGGNFVTELIPASGLSPTIFYKLRDAENPQKLFFARLDSVGNLRITRTRGKIYVSEISMSEARSIKSRAKEYQRALDYTDQND